MATCYFRFNTIFAVKELNFCVRDGNRCILFAIVTNLLLEKLFSENMIMCIFIKFIKYLWLNPRSISIGQLNISLCFHFQPINQIVFLGSYFIKNGKTHLEVGFPLRCFQRLSIPYIATLHCHWRDNRYTRGMSVPVLSY